MATATNPSSSITVYTKYMSLFLFLFKSSRLFLFCCGNLVNSVFCLVNCIVLHLFEHNKTVGFIKRIIDIAYWRGMQLNLNLKPYHFDWTSVFEISQFWIVTNDNKMSLISYHAFYCHLRMRSSNRTTLSDSACQSTFRETISVQ